MRKRATVFYTGRVQGVGFRYTAREIACGYELTGYARNLHDGRVEDHRASPGIRLRDDGLLVYDAGQSSLL